MSIMRQQIAQLHDMMRTSLLTSDKLRKRITAISRYYEDIIRKLQQQIVHAKTERKRMETDFMNQVFEIDHDNRFQVMTLQMKLRRKDEEIKRLKQMEI